jgi:hypothetical protein
VGHGVRHGLEHTHQRAHVGQVPLHEDLAQDRQPFGVRVGGGGRAERDGAAVPVEHRLAVRQGLRTLLGVATVDDLRHHAAQLLQQVQGGAAGPNVLRRASSLQDRGRDGADGALDVGLDPVDLGGAEGGHVVVVLFHGHGGVLPGRWFRELVCSTDGMS